MDFPGGSVVENPPASAGDSGLIPGSGVFPGGGNGNPLQCSCLDDPMDRGAWWTVVHRVEKESDTTEQQNNSLSHIYTIDTCIEEIMRTYSIEQETPPRALQ